MVHYYCFLLTMPTTASVHIDNENYHCRNLFRQVHEDEEISPPRDGSRLPGALRTAQGNQPAANFVKKRGEG